MALRYWVGGSGNWSNTARWSTTSGGVGGASVPTAADDVIINASSATAGTKFTITVDGSARTCQSLTLTPTTNPGVIEIALSFPLTVTGNFTTSGTAGNNRFLFRSSTFGSKIDFTCNGAVSISDCDFRDIRLIGTSAPISGTRIGDLRGNLGINFSAPKTVYWNLAGAQNWSATAWASTSGGTPSTDNFPLAQDIAVFNDAGSVTGNITMDSAIPYTGTIDMSARTSAMTLFLGAAYGIYGDIKAGSGLTFSNAQTWTFSGRKVQTITSAGKNLSCSITIDSFGGSVELLDALNVPAQTITINNGTFTTNGFAVSAGFLVSSNSNVRMINLGASSVTLTGTTTPLNFNTNTNLIFNPGTSTIFINTTNATVTFQGGAGTVFNNVTFSNNTVATTKTIDGASVFNNLTMLPAVGVLSGFSTLLLNNNITVTGTFTCSGNSVFERCYVGSNNTTLSNIRGTQRTITVQTLVANDCNFEDINIAGAAAGVAPTRAGDCGNNAGITFSTKTVYKVGASTDWKGSNSWALTSGGVGSNNNYPLPQDTAVIDDNTTSSSFSPSNSNFIGTLDFSNRTNAFTADFASGWTVYGSMILSNAVTVGSTSTMNFRGRGNNVLRTSGRTWSPAIFIDCFTGTLSLDGALTATNQFTTLTLNGGTFTVGNNNVTVSTWATTNASINKTINFGTGVWTLYSNGSIYGQLFERGSGGVTTYNYQDATFIASNSNANYLRWNNAGGYVKKLTLAGAGTGAEFQIFATNSFGELASTKTVGFTIQGGNNSFTIGKWSITGSAGNVVNFTGSNTVPASFNILSVTSGVDYLNFNTLNSTGGVRIQGAPFYAGANSTGNGGSINTAAPTPRTLYWVGGSGNWSDTARWSTSSGGAGGQPIPTIFDNVIFDSASSASSYTATINAANIVRCKDLTMGGPASGTLTFAMTNNGSIISGSLVIAPTVVTRSGGGDITFVGLQNSNTITTNGFTFGTNVTIQPVGGTYTLGSALTHGSTSTFTINAGTFNSAGYSISTGTITSNTFFDKTVILDSSTISTGVANALNLVSNYNSSASFTNSQINLSSATPGIPAFGVVYNNVTCTSTAITALNILDGAVFNNLTVTGRTSAGVGTILLGGNMTVNGTFTVLAGSNRGRFLLTNSANAPRTITCGATNLTDVDIRYITFAGAAVPVSGTRLGDCQFNTGVTFGAPRTLYWNLAGTQNWTDNGWSATSGGSPTEYMPLAQDTAIINNDSAGTQLNFNPAGYSIGTLDCSGRTSGTFTLNSQASFNIYKDFILGSAIAITGTQTQNFVSNSTMVLSCNGRTLSFPVNVNTSAGTLELGSAFLSNNTLTVSNGTFSALTYNVTCSVFSTFTSTPKTVNMGSGLWTITGTGIAWDCRLMITQSLTLNKQTANILLSDNSATARTFAGNNQSYNKLTIGGSTGTSTTTISNNNTFTEIVADKTVAHTIALGGDTQRVGAFNVSGTLGNITTITGTSSNLIYTGVGSVPPLYYLNVQGRAYGPNYETTGIWDASTTSISSGSFGWDFTANPPLPASNANFFLLFA